MEINYTKELTGVFGYPVAENPTCIIAEAAYKQLGVPYVYLTLEVKPEDLEGALQAVKTFRMKGINLTMPHKVNVLKYLDGISDEAKLMGAVNTICVEDGKLFGTNTDGKGFVIALKERNVDLAGRTVVLLGAGGAARAIAVELSNSGVGKIIIVNRTKERGEELAALINDNTSATAEYRAWTPAIDVGEADILINATNIGLYPGVENTPDIDFDSIKKDAVVCDVIPNPANTKFLQKAAAKGNETVDGLGMLVNQAAANVEMWTGKMPDKEVMIKALEEEYSSYC